MGQFLTIITPTYNRVSELHKLYVSLCRQSNTEFLWLIIDDGSNDDTENVVSSWKDQNLLNISYVKQQNGGKHTALNTGICMVRTLMTMIVDSDDWLIDDAVAKIYEYDQKYNSRITDHKICGYSFLRAFSDGRINAEPFPENEIIGTYRELRVNRKDLGDKAEVFYTDVLKKYPFPVFPGERFLPEDAVWIKMSGPYQMVHINTAIYLCDYLDGGLTKTGRYMKIYSPYGMMYRSAMYMGDHRVKRSVRLKMLLLYVIYEYFGSADEYLVKISKAVLQEDRSRCRIQKGIAYYLFKIPGWLIYKSWKKRYMAEKK